MIATKERLAFDIALAERRIKESPSKKSAILGIAKDWSGFAWEYGFKNVLRFTPFDHYYYQDLSSSQMIMACEEDLGLGIDFTERIDPEERGGLVLASVSSVREKFFSSEPGDQFIWASPPDPNLKLPYGFLYYGVVEDTPKGKRLATYDFFTDLSEEECSEFLGLTKDAQTEEILTAQKNVDFNSIEDVWAALIATKPEAQIFGKSLDEILRQVNLPLLFLVRQKSYQEAERIFDNWHQGIPTDTLQSQVNGRLIEFVREFVGEKVVSEIRWFGSCGGINGPSWAEYNAITGEFICKLCCRSFPQNLISSHRCAC